MDGRHEPTLKEIIDVFGEKTAEAWARKGYRAWKKRQDRQPRQPSRANEILKGATAETLAKICDEALRKYRGL